MLMRTPSKYDAQRGLETNFIVSLRFTDISAVILVVSLILVLVVDTQKAVVSVQTNTISTILVFQIVIFAISCSFDVLSLS